MTLTADRLLPWLEPQLGESLDAVVLDVDGVLIIGDAPAPHAPALLELLEESDTPFILLTNDGSRAPHEKAMRLAKRGIHVTGDRVVSSSHGLDAALEANPSWRAKRFFIIGGLGTPCYADAAGLETTTDLADLPDCDGIIVGEGDFDWEATLQGAINFYIRKPDAPLVVPNTDVYYRIETGDVNIASGGWAAWIQQAVAAYGYEVTATFLGKPYGPIFAYAHGVLEARAGKSLERQRVMMIGDSLHHDIAGAADFGYRNALLLTGVITEDTLLNHDHKPDHLFKGL